MAARLMLKNPNAPNCSTAILNICEENDIYESANYFAKIYDIQGFKL